MQKLTASERIYTFGPFRLFATRHLLFEHGKSVRLGSRAVDILIALVERAGEVVTKDDLIASVWPNIFVHESNLRVNIATLRKAIRDGQDDASYIISVAGRGYRFVAPVSVDEDTKSSNIRDAGAKLSGQSLPAQLARMLGREEVTRAIAVDVASHRLVTITGPGGIGKTTVAIAVARGLVGTYSDGVHFIDLAPIADPRRVASALTSQLRIGVNSEDPLPDLIASLADRHALIVLDSCEHVVEAAAILAEAVLCGTQRVDILATSREPLRAEVEHVHRLAPLEVPSSTITLTAADAIGYSAIELFVDRAVGNSSGFNLTDEDAPILCEICTRLDGIPLAIELAARRVDAFGVSGLRTVLDDRFRVLTGGRRAALPRHQTLGAALDWSYELLTPPERIILRRLGIFAGNFDLESAIAVARFENTSSGDVAECIANLVAKSLISADTGGGTALYRLLDTTRAYAAEKLKASGEFDAVAMRHARQYITLMNATVAQWETRPKSEWIEVFLRRVDNVRGALDWAYSANGDRRLAVELTVASELLWTHLSLVNEAISRVRRALDVLETERDSAIRDEMRLRAALGWLIMQALGPVEEVLATWIQVAELAEQLDDNEYRSRANLSLWIYHYNVGNFRTALEIAEQYRLLVDTRVEPVAMLTLEHQMAISFHTLGDQDRALSHIRRILDGYGERHQLRDDRRFVHDQRSGARSFLARIQWMRGFPDQALATVRENIADRGTHENALTLGNALAHACPVVFGIGDMAEAGRLVAMLRDTAVRHGLTAWEIWARGYGARLMIENGSVAEGVIALRSVTEDLGELAFEVYRTGFIGALADGLCRKQDLDEATIAISEAINRSERMEEGWCLPDLYRTKGDIALAQGMLDTAESQYLHSIEIARAQKALAWELRSTASLGLFCKHRRSASRRARDLLGGVIARCSEGYDTTDYCRAMSVLADLNRAIVGSGKYDG